MTAHTTIEKVRLQETRAQKKQWKKWGPYLSERQWGTVREDYSGNGDAWNYFPHDHARSRAYKWGEDGLAGISDDRQQVCFALALWNGRDPILKERLFGLSNGEGNHGEDVKEYYFYLDSTPTHSYMKYLYKYPQAPFPYLDLIQVNANRGRQETEFELIDTGIFDDNRYFDVFVEYAKASPEDILIRVTAHNRGPEAATVHLLPSLWFRNNWQDEERPVVPNLALIENENPSAIITGKHPVIGEFFLIAEDAQEVLFTNNETNHARIFGSPNPSPYVKDGINNYVVNGQADAVNPAKKGTKAATHHTLHIEAGASQAIRLRLWFAHENVHEVPTDLNMPGIDFDSIFTLRIKEADEFYENLIPASMTREEQHVMRQALSGMLWTKQYFNYDLGKWLKQHGVNTSRPTHTSVRNAAWSHMNNADVITMPDKWEYPWYAAWDLAFHVLPLMLVDEDFAKGQMELMLGTEYQHPNGQIPAYEWNFSDVNPPVHAWSTIFSFFLEKSASGKGDLPWLERCFHKLMLNFTWWVNRKDRDGSNVFEGGFLGLDNIGVFDRSAPLPTGGFLEQADGTAWMTLFCQNMIEIGSQLAMENPAYKEITKKFFEHFLIISSSMIRADEDGGMWDEADGFFYDVLRLPDGRSQRLKVRSMVGLLPLCAVTVFDREMGEKYPDVPAFLKDYLSAKPDLTAFIQDPAREGVHGRLLASVLNERNLARVLSIMLDEQEFLSPYGIRALSRIHADHPFVFLAEGREYKVSYMPGESGDNMFGGNSNWRGPIWMPVNMLIIRALLNYYRYYGNNFQVECPTGSGIKMNMFEVAQELSRRLSSIFLKDGSGHRPVFGQYRKFQEDPHWNEYVLFHEYFHGDTGAGIGASHQTGWTGVIASIMHLFKQTTMDDALVMGKEKVFRGSEKTAKTADT